MNQGEAFSFINSYYRNPNPKDDDKFMLEEAYRYLIDTSHNPMYMHDLACFYMEERRHDLELKYLEMAAEYSYPPSLEELGYIWYYGQTGEIDYKKAYDYFMLASKSGDDVVKAWSIHKLADMYHNGYYVEKDEKRYKEMVESLYEWMRNPGKIHSVYYDPANRFPFPDVLYRLAKIRVEEGKEDEAVGLLREARSRLSEDIRNNTTWWGNIEVIDQVVCLEHEIAPSAGRINIYDLCWIADKVCKIAFLYMGRRFIICVHEDKVIEFDGKWFRTPREFLEKAELDGEKIVYLYDALYDMEVSYE